MNLSLDTHVLLWTLSAPERLSEVARNAIEDPANIVFVSAAVAWEIEIKAALGKLRAPSDLLNQLAAANFQELPITIAHALAIKQLPNLHRDPFAVEHSFRDRRKTGPLLRRRNKCRKRSCPEKRSAIRTPSKTEHRSGTVGTSACSGRQSRFRRRQNL